MRTTLRIAYRNTKRQKKRSMMLGGAIAFGVMVITLLNAFTAGMITNVKSNFSYVFGGHIYISGTELTESGRVISSIGNDNIVRGAINGVTSAIKQINRRSQAFGEMVFGSKSMMQSLDGVDWLAEKDLPSKLMVTSGSLENLANKQSLVLPKTVANKLGVAVGETVLMRLSTVTGQQNVGEFQLVAIIKDQTSFGVSTGYAHLTYLNELLGLKKDAYQLLHIVLNDMKDMDAVSNTIYTNLKSKAEVEPRLKINFEMDDDDDGNDHEREREAISRMFGGGQQSVDKPWKGTKFAVTTLNDIMSPVMSMVGVLNTVGLVVFLILLAITMIGITNTFRMVLIERTGEIGTMRAFGMQRNVVRNIFVSEALIIGLAGAFVGLILAALIMVGLTLVRWSDTSMLQFFMDKGRFTFRIMPLSVVLNLFILMMMTLLAAYMPARAAARLRPADALRAQF